MMSLNQMTGLVVDTALSIHHKLGPGLLESVYLNILAHELRRENLGVATEVPVPIVWDGMKLEVGFRADLIVEGLVLVELKSVETIAKVHQKQLLTYLRLTDLRVGLLINFGQALLKDGIHRVVNKFDDYRAAIEEPGRDPAPCSAGSAALREILTVHMNPQPPEG